MWELVITLFHSANVLICCLFLSPLFPTLILMYVQRHRNTLLPQHTFHLLYSLQTYFSSLLFSSLQCFPLYQSTFSLSMCCISFHPHAPNTMSWITVLNVKRVGVNSCHRPYTVWTDGTHLQQRGWCSVNNKIISVRNKLKCSLAPSFSLQTSAASIMEHVLGCCILRLFLCSAP